MDTVNLFLPVNEIMLTCLDSAFAITACLFHSFLEQDNFWNPNISQGSVATCAGCGGIFNTGNHFIAKFLENLPVKNFTNQLCLTELLL